MTRTRARRGGKEILIVELVDLQGYQAENPNIALLRLRSFTLGRKLKDDEVVGPGTLKKIADLIGILTPYVGRPISFFS